MYHSVLDSGRYLGHDPGCLEHSNSGQAGYQIRRPFFRAYFLPGQLNKAHAYTQSLDHTETCTMTDSYRGLLALI